MRSILIASLIFSLPAFANTDSCGGALTDGDRSPEFNNFLQRLVNFRSTQEPNQEILLSQVPTPLGDPIEFNKMNGPRGKEVEPFTMFYFGEFRLPNSERVQFATTIDGRALMVVPDKRIDTENLISSRNPPSFAPPMTEKSGLEDIFAHDLTFIESLTRRSSQTLSFVDRTQQLVAEFTANNPINATFDKLKQLRLNPKMQLAFDQFLKSISEGKSGLVLMRVEPEIRMIQDAQGQIQRYELLSPAHNSSPEKSKIMAMVAVNMFTIRTGGHELRYFVTLFDPTSGLIFPFAIDQIPAQNFIRAIVIDRP